MYLKDNKKLSEGYQSVRIDEIWKERMGKMIATYTKTIQLKNGILEVSISSSPLKKELQMSKTQIISAINEELGGNIIVDVGRAEALLKKTQQIRGEMFKVGDEIEVQIINVDKDSKRISLSMKQLERNPWLDASNKYEVGSKVKGKVRGFTDYGAFVELESGLEGMIHISDMSWTRKINHPQDLLQKGQQVDVVVLAVDADNRKINLGLKQLTDNPWPELSKKYPVDEIVDAEVVLNSNFGVFVKLENDVEALVYSSEIDKDKATTLKPSDKLKVKIIKVDVEQMKIGVSARV